jgi:prepilin peptidase CpaA
MFALVVFLSGLFVVIAYGGMAAYSDFKGMTIPNQYSIVIFGVFAVCYALVWLLGGGSAFAPILSHLLGFVLVFIFGFALFVLKVWGAGDQKLVSAFAVWMGFSGVVVFLFYTALFGGLLGIVALCLRKFKPVKEPGEGSWIAQVQDGGGKVPYGIAIMLGALASFVKIGYFSVDTFRIFLG